jgi:hypothetical protein
VEVRKNGENVKKKTSTRVNAAKKHSEEFDVKNFHKSRQERSSSSSSSSSWHRV